MNDNLIGENVVIEDYCVIENNVTIGNGSKVSPFCVVREGVKIGENCIIHPNVTLEKGVELGDNVEIFPGAYLGKTPKGAGATTRQIQVKDLIKIGNNSCIGAHAVIFKEVLIGDNTLIGDSALIREECNIGNYCIIGRGSTLHYDVVVGDRSKIMTYTNLTGHTRIGKDVFISGYVMTTNDNKFGAENYGEHVYGPKIEDNAMIGAAANLLPNVTIGKNAVVGASSLVTKNVPENVVVMGLPARIRENKK